LCLSLKSPRENDHRSMLENNRFLSKTLPYDSRIDENER
jgi:hypothetical protein